jgi:hypothetical protein
MHDTAEILALLQIADIAKNWPELLPIHNRALEKLREIAKAPAHRDPPKPEPVIAKRGANA